MMRTEYIECIFIFVFHALAPQFQTEHSVVCGNESSKLQCHENKTIDITYVDWYSWKYKCISAQESNCHVETTLIKEKCNTENTCILEEDYFNACSKQPRLVVVEFYCTPRGWWLYSRQNYIKHVAVCGSLADIHCRWLYTIKEIVFLRYEAVGACDVERDIEICMKNVFKRCIGTRSCGNIGLNYEKCFHFPLMSKITYSCNKEGIDSSTTTVKNTRKYDIIQTAEVPLRTIVFDTKTPPKSGENEWILDLDKDSRLLVLNKKRNKTYSLCANSWKNEHASIVCRLLNLSDSGIAGDIPRIANLERIAYGVDCSFNITNPFGCSLDYRNVSREICKSMGDASVRCYNHTEHYFSDKTDFFIKTIGGGASFLATTIIFLLVIIYIQRRKLMKASYTTLTVRRDENNYSGIPQQISASNTDQWYEVLPLSVIPTSEGQSAAQQNINQIQHIDTSGYLISSNIFQNGGDRYQTIAN